MSEESVQAKTSVGWIEMFNFTTAPTDTKANMRGLCFVGGSLKYWNGSSFASISGSGGVSTWDELYDSDKTLTLDDGTMTFLLTKTTGNGITFSGGAAATGAPVAISNAGSGADILGTSSTWQVSKAGAATFASVVAESLTAAANLTIDATGSGTITIAGTSTGAITLGASVGIAASKTLTLTGADGSTIVTVTAGDVVVSNGSLALTDTDNAGSFTITNNTISTATLATFTANAVTSGTMLALVTTASGFVGGYFFTCNDGSNRFTVGVDGATAIATGVASTKALEITGIQTSENLVTLTSSGVTADDKAIVLINSSGNAASGSNQIRIEPSGTPVEGSIGIEFVGAGKVMQGLLVDGDSVNNSVAKFTGSGALAANKAIVEIIADGTPAAASAAGLRVDITGITATNTPYAIRALANGKDAGGLYIDADGATLSPVAINGGGAIAANKAVVEITADGTPAAASAAALRVDVTGITATNTPYAVRVLANGKDAGGLFIDSDSATLSAVAINGGGAIATGKAVVELTADGVPAATDSSVLSITFSGTATNKPRLVTLTGTGKDCGGIYLATDNTTTHGVSITGAGALNGGNALLVTNTGTPAAATDAVARVTFGGTATNNPIVLKVDNGTADAQPLNVNSNVASATRAVATLKQDSTTGANVCLELAQDDVDQAFLKLTGTSGSGDSIDTDDKSTGTAVYVKILIGSTPYWLKATPGA